MLQIENDKVRLERVGFAHEASLYDEFRRAFRLKSDGILESTSVKSNEFRERFAKSIAELIISDWDRLVFDERHEPSESGDTMVSSAYMFIIRKKEKEGRRFLLEQL